MCGSGFGIRIRIHKDPEYGSGSTALQYIYMCGSGFVFGIRIGNHKPPEYGSESGSASSTLITSMVENLLL